MPRTRILPLVLSAVLFTASALARPDKVLIVSPDNGKDDPNPSPLSASPPTEEEKLREEIGELRGKLESLQKRLALAQRDLRHVKHAQMPREGTPFHILAGFGVLRPSSHTFPAPTGALGPGAYLGVGTWLGAHDFELTLDYDIYLATTLRYHYAFGAAKRGISFGPVIGVKQKLHGLLAWGDYIPRNDLISGTNALVGFRLAYPIDRSELSLEADYLRNRESIVAMILALHFFF